MYRLILVVVLILISGLIAYIGDQIGMKVGRKRLSLFGLRPRHTSILVTILTGILIATTTITLLLVTSRGVRMALFNMQEMIAELNTLSRKVSVKDEQLQQMQEQIQAKSDELASLKEEKKQITQQLSETNQEYQQVKDKLEQADQELADLTAEKKKLSDQVASLKGEVSTLEEKIQELTTQKEELATKVDNLSYGLQFMGQKYLDSAVGDIVYQKGEVIYSDVIDGGQSDQTTVKELDHFIKQANQSALERGITTEEEERVIKMYEDDLFQTAKSLRQKEQRMIVRLIAQKNTLQNEEVLAKFKLYPDRLVYDRGETIAQINLQADESLKKLESDLEGFLTEINKQAIQDGLIPNSQGQVGSLGFSRFYSLFNQIKERKQRVTVKVVAVKDIWRSNILASNIKFVVEASEE
ncbi:MAG: DUF3084 domain-containing protein [Bacillota bacterium]